MAWVFAGLLAALLGLNVFVLLSYGRGQTVPNGLGLTGKEAAAKLLKSLNLTETEVEPRRANAWRRLYSERFLRRKGHLRLPEADEENVTALVLALRGAVRVNKLEARLPAFVWQARLAGLFTLLSNLSIWVLLAGLIIGDDRLQLVGGAGLGAALFGQLLGLPAELELSREAKRLYADLKGVQDEAPNPRPAWVGSDPALKLLRRGLLAAALNPLGSSVKTMMFPAHVILGLAQDWREAEEERATL